LQQSYSKISKIPFYSLDNISIHNSNGIDIELIIANINNNFMNKIGKSYYKRKES